jgi:toxin FitB
LNGIILDTCLVSEPKRARPDECVRAWFEAQDPYRLYLTTTIIGELADGIARLPTGKRRRDYSAWLEGLIEADFVGRLLPFDVDAALRYGELVARAYAKGRPPHVVDAQIAAVAQQRDMAVATHNVADFAMFDVAVINPWVAIRA